MWAALLVGALSAAGVAAGVTAAVDGGSDYVHMPAASLAAACGSDSSVSASATEAPRAVVSESKKKR